MSNTNRIPHFTVLFMSTYKYISDTIQKEYSERSQEYKNRLMKWRKESPIARVERPTNLPRARTLGYKAKQGYAIVRVRVKRGMRRRPDPMGGRKAKNSYKFKSTASSHQNIAEQRANRRYRNMEVLNSYWIGEDGMAQYFEIILVDPTKIDISTVKRKGRSFRGLTSSGKKGRPSKKKTPNKSIRRRKLREKLPKKHGKRAEKEKKK